MLESGFPGTLTYSYVSAITANALSCVVLISLGTRHSALTEVLVDSM